jgi:hypothetical protein
MECAAHLDLMTLDELIEKEVHERIAAISR